MNRFKLAYPADPSVSPFSWIGSVFHRPSWVKEFQVIARDANRIGNGVVDYRIDYLPVGVDPISGTWVDTGVTEAVVPNDTTGVNIVASSAIWCAGYRIVYIGASNDTKTICSLQAKIATINHEMASYQESLEGIDYNFEPNLILIDGFPAVHSPIFNPPGSAVISLFVQCVTQSV